MQDTEMPEELPEEAILNDASLECIKNQYQLESFEGGQRCVFDDGSWCEEWAYYNGNCIRGEFY